MAEGILSFPFRIGSQGNAAETPYASDTEVDEAIAALVLTQVGERPLHPEYGVPDPGFAGLHTGDIQVGLDAFGPAGIVVDEIVMKPTSPTSAVADIRWSREGENDD